jgi:hypothetical protein
MKKLLFAIFFGLCLTVARASDDDEDRGRGRGRGRDDDDEVVTVVPEPSTYAAIGFVTVAVAFTVYRNKRKS